MLPLWTFPEADILRTSGADAATYLRILSLGHRLFLFLCLWCTAVVLPVNLAGGEIEELLIVQQSQVVSNLSFILMLVLVRFGMPTVLAGMVSPRCAHAVVCHSLGL